MELLIWIYVSEMSCGVEGVKKRKDALLDRMFDSFCVSNKLVINEPSSDDEEYKGCCLSQETVSAHDKGKRVADDIRTVDHNLIEGTFVLFI